MKLLIPLLLAGTALWGTLRGVDVWNAMAEGAKEGLAVLLRIFPYLVGLMTVIAMLRASGALEGMERLLAPALEWMGLPVETLPLMLTRPFSGSGALGVGAELIETYGPDSAIGRTAAVMLGSTETTFYTVAVYFGAVGVKDSRYAIPAALAADFTGFLLSSWTVKLLF